MAGSLRRMGGFTAAEILVVLAVVGILTAMAGPYMGDMVRAQRLRTASFDVFSSLMLARSEAIKRNTSVTMSPSGGGWNGGWTIADSNGNTVRRQGAIDTVTIAGPASVTFLGTGRLNASVNPFSLVAVGSTGSTSYRCVSVDLSGRPVSTEAQC